MEKERLVDEAATALEAYRRLLRPGREYFAGLIVGGECVGIIEEREGEGLLEWLKHCDLAIDRQCGI